MLISPSKTYLFDNYCTGRLKYPSGCLAAPKSVWKYSLQSYPAHAPESTPVFDNFGNIYFGAHDGCFYSLTSYGKLRWMFKTGGKIYSSPAIIDDLGIFVASGNGFLHSFGFDGNLRWTYHLSKYDKADGFVGRKLQAYHLWKKMYDPVRKKVWNCKVWASPKISSDNCILITGFGMGLHSVDAVTGCLHWLFNLGGLQYNRSSVALGQNSQIYIASHCRFLHCLDTSGSCKWSYDTGMSYDSWGGPSVDIAADTIYFPLAYKHHKGIVFAMDSNGNKRWHQKIPGAIRGSVTVCYDSYVVVCGLNGIVYFLSKKNGKIVHSIQLTRADRGLWTTASVDPEGYIFITSKDSRESGSVYCIDQNGHIKWRYKTGKALSTPVMDAKARLYFGTWDGEFICLQT